MKYIITSAYGAVEGARGGRPHTGVDLAMPEGTPLRSFCDGVVERVTDYGGADIGNGVIVKAHDGVRYIYGHMDKVNVHAGDTVHTGTLLGLSGNSGHSTGPHLHFAETVDGQFVDPTPVIGQVDKMTGGAVDHGSWWANFADNFNVEKHVHDAVQDAIMGALSATGDVVLHLAYAVTLVGGGILILLKYAGGFEHRWLRPSVLIVAYVALKYLFSGGE